MTAIQDLASQIVNDVQTKHQARGVLVLLIHETDDEMGCAMSTGELPLDSMIGCVVQALGTLRRQAIEEMSSETLSNEPPTTN
jgi:hypothetical protein